MKPTYTIAGHNFKYKKDIAAMADRLRKDVRNYDQNLTAADEMFISALSHLHDGFVRKVGDRVISHYEVRSYPEEYGTVCFWVVFTDGTAEDFSLKTVYPTIKPDAKFFKQHVYVTLIRG